MATVWGPYHEVYAASEQMYLLFRAPNPYAVRESTTPSLKEEMSMLLEEILKPAHVFGTPIPGTDGISNEPDGARIQAAIAMMDQSVVKAVERAKEPREAILILSFYDPRCEDLVTNRSLSERLFHCFQHSRLLEKKRPGPRSESMNMIRNYFEKHRQRILRALAKDHSLRARQALAMEITSRVVDTRAQKPDGRVMRFIRTIVPNKRPKRKDKATR